MKSLVLLLVATCVVAAADAPPVPPEVLAEAAHVAELAKTKAAAGDPPSADTLKVADDVEAQLVACRVLLDQHEPAKAGECFISAVTALQGLSRGERKALGTRYQEQRQQLQDLALRLLADPAVAAALNRDDERPVPAVPPAKAAETPAKTGDR